MDPGFRREANLERNPISFERHQNSPPAGWTRGSTSLFTGEKKLDVDGRVKPGKGD
jgi:hypothetical protein